MFDVVLIICQPPFPPLLSLYIGARRNPSAVSISRPSCQLALCLKLAGSSRSWR